MLFSHAIFTLASLAAGASAFRFTVWLGDKCTISGNRPSDEEVLVFPMSVGSGGCMKYQLMKYGYDQSLMIRPETADKDDDYLVFFQSQDCSGDPLLMSPPASVLRERPVAGCSNYAAAGITEMSYMVAR